MSFIFRSIFWLSLALVVVPPEARLGGVEEVEWRDIDLGLALHTAANAAWGIAAQTASACESNRGLCGAGTSLWNSTVSTVTELATETHDRTGDPPSQRPAPKAKKIHARVE